jgi:cytochrome c biogenesis protein CcmG, thiol:disulfide interchange protein DsbE
MGKASRSKRERHARTGDGGDGSSLPRIDVPTERRPFPVFWSVVALLVVGGLAALVLTAPDQDARDREAAASDAPVYADVRVEGAQLQQWTGTGSDSAEGSTVPTIAGTDIEGRSLALMPGGGAARAYVVVAHWCPHCQEEVPRLVEWARDNELPMGVEVVAVSTSVDRGQPNFPPAAWLAREDWPWPVFVDDEVGSAGDALGVQGYPFMVFTDAEGTVVSRYSGEMPIDEWDAAIRSIAPNAQ